MVRYEAFRARCLLAALDHNNHTTRDDVKQKPPVKLNSTGNSIKILGSGQ